MSVDDIYDTYKSHMTDVLYTSEFFGGNLDKKVRYKKGYKYQLSSTFVQQTKVRVHTDIDTEYIKLDTKGVITILKGYAWDGASGPTIDTPDCIRGSLVHDALYQLMRMGKVHKIYRNLADLELKRLCIEDGMNKLKAHTWYLAVKLFAKKCVEPGFSRKLLIAP